MKRGSKAIRCDKCGCIVAWVIPTGIKDYGIPRVEYHEKDNCVVLDKGMQMIYRCKQCNK